GADAGGQGRRRCGPAGIGADRRPRRGPSRPARRGAPARRARPRPAARGGAARRRLGASAERAGGGRAHAPGGSGRRGPGNPPRGHRPRARVAVTRRSVGAAAALLVLAPWLLQAALGPRYGGELKVGVLELPATTEPGIERGGGAGLVAALVHETLVGVDEEGFPSPALAQGWTAAAGGREWTLRLREGALFHDGRPVTAADAARSLRRFLRS